MFSIRVKGRDYKLVGAPKTAVTPLTKDHPSTLIRVEYEECSVLYRWREQGKNADPEQYEASLVWGRQRDLLYTPVDPRLLRYSKDDVVTEDHVPCRLTLFRDSYLVDKPRLAPDTGTNESNEQLKKHKHEDEGVHRCRYELPRKKESTDHMWTVLMIVLVVLAVLSLVGGLTFLYRSRTCSKLKDGGG